MTNFNWKILEVFAKDDAITHVKYHLTGQDDANLVETEGYWYFDCPEVKVPFNEVTEEMIVKWIEEDAVTDGVCHITNNVQKQLEALKSNQTTIAPWLPQIFNPEI